MILTNLWLSNFRNHRKLHLNLKTGVTGIVGDNGTGKSSIIESILFALTGQLFYGSKQEAMTLGEDTGSVSIGFILHDKPGKLQRHLDVPKVTLTYDGVDYKKSTEVKELWDKLLQISTEIVEKVIIAQQGHIPMLFSGEQSVREKVFQKIFLVPNTERLRKILWDKYLKQAPPIIPVEDIHQLKDNYDKAENEFNRIQYDIKQLNILSEDKLDELKTHLAYLNKCVGDVGKHGILMEGIKNVYEQQEDLKTKIKDIKLALGTDRIATFERQRTMLLQCKGIYAQKLKLESELEQLVLPYSREEYVVCKNDYRQLEIHKTELYESLVEAKHWNNALAGRVNSIIAVKDEDVCPKCGQKIQITDEEFKALEDEFAKSGRTMEQLFIDHRASERDLAVLSRKIAQYDNVDTDRKQLTNQLAQFKAITFDEETLNKINEAIDYCKELQKDLNDSNIEYHQLETKKAMLEKELNDIAIYSGNSSAERERNDVSNKIANNTDNIRIYQQKSIQLKVKEAELISIAERLETATISRDKNTKRNKYVETLNKIYDVLHSSQFPRKLILNYADVVTERLQENLDCFNIPYKARVADNFKIEMLDDDDRVLPVVSGGQEIQVGISLHLGLHDLFSQSFPLLIVDEGTTHLDQTNRKAYFEIIKNLKEKSKLRQILIIDHDPALAEVVDHIINLNEKD